MPRLLIVSPHFPPVNAPDMQRVRMSLPSFVEAGWEVTVLTVADPTPTAPLEPELDATVPTAVRIERAYCLSRRWTAYFGVNNVVLRSLPFLFLAGCRLLAARRYDVVYFSTTMFSVLPLGRLWKMLYGAPYVIDLQDPWVGDFHQRPGAAPPPGGWKYRVVQSVDRILEGWTMREVSHVITVSTAYTATLRDRYPWWRNTPATELPFGSPDADLRHVAANLASRPPILPVGGLRLAFAGAIGPGMLAAVEVLFAAVQLARQAGQPVSVYFFGTTYSPAKEIEPVTLPLAAKYGLQDCVHEQPGRLRFFDALQVTLEAELNLLFGSTDLGFTPSKILTVLAAGRPVLALAPAGSAMVPRLAQLGQSCIVFPPEGDVAASVRETAGQLQSVTRQPSSRLDPALLGRHSAHAAALQQLAIFSQVVASASRHTDWSAPTP